MQQARTGGSVRRVAAAWRLLTDDTDERQCFVDLETTLSLPSTPAAPDNRLRHVTRIETAGGACYLKTFRRTQGKNRVRFALTRPRAADDAEREYDVRISYMQVYQEHA